MRRTSRKENAKTRFKQHVKHFLVKHGVMYKTLYYLYSLLVNFDGREHWLRRKEGTKIYYVIRPRTNCIEGLLALYLFVMKKMDYALKNDYIPVIDMKNYKTQYYNGKDNVWEWFFGQPTEVSLDEVYNGSESVLLSGYKWNSKEDETLFSEVVFSDDELNQKCYDLMFNNIRFNEYIGKIVAEEAKKVCVEECIGVYLRGTDYVKMRPVGENVQPNAESVIEIIHEFRNKYGRVPIYLVTEDNDIYLKIKNEFRDELRLVSYDSFIIDYDGKNFLSKSGVFKKNMRTVGEEYLVKMILLSKCKYLVSSITCGSRVSYVWNGNAYADKYVFDLGKYE